MKNILLLVTLILLTACAAPPNIPAPGPPAHTATFTVPPLPSPTPWSTKTPRPTRTATPTPHACWSAGGQLVEESIPTNLLPAPIPVRIYLPPCYHQFPDTDYPALYLFHGQGFDHTQWPRLGITTLADEWIASGQAPPLLIVMPAIEDWNGPADSAFGQAVIEELVPYLEAQYRARPNRENRVVGGVSRGGSWAIHLGLAEWETFAAFGAHSAPVFFDDAPYILYWLAAIPEQHYPRIYLDYAESDQSIIRRSVNEFISQLGERYIPYTFSTAPGAHNESYWASQVEIYFAFYIKGFE
ncbi:MAG: hypothetical protein JW757_06790 [Anaerolineales bacterium]|nr:hypothetical protein [Anaerolineales bacterium]